MTAKTAGIAVALTRGGEDLAPLLDRQEGGIRYGTDGEVLFGAVETDGTDIERATRLAYESLLALTRREGFPHLLRIWNYVGGINEGEGDEERYRLFCAGRHEAFAAAAVDRLRFPAASAVGTPGRALSIHFLASREAGIQVENPRQVSAYDYPRQYGRRSPSFARATVATLGGERVAFIAGTSSVVGHRTLHPGDAAAQLEETFRNLEVIFGRSGEAAGGRAGLADAEIVKVYVRRGVGREDIGRRVRERMPSPELVVVENDICRKDLLLEIEAVVRIRVTP